jgi:succinate-semialdehyde dehydrogenase/glutarate-semialdehyde dehydrogenase
VQSASAPAFIEAIAPRVRKLRVGNGMDDGVQIGPLIHRDGFLKVLRHVEDALDAGAERLVGDDPRSPAHEWGAFFPPTVLSGVTPDMSISREETFGPVVPIGTFGSEDEAIALANGTPFGLAAYVFTRDDDRAQRVAAALRFGHVGINTGAGPTPEAPFGGMKQSGFGREGGDEGILEFCETQTTARAS